VDSLFYVNVWLLPTVFIGVAVGWMLGRTTTRNRPDSRDVQRQADATLRTLAALLEMTEQLSTDVGSHNSNLEKVGRHVSDMHLTGELEDVQHTILGQVASLLESNRRLESDLTYSRGRMEEQAHELDRTRQEARTDGLTGIANRKGFDEKLALMLAAWQRKKEPFVLGLADIDHFKWVNDTHGHQAGDRVVGHVGQLMRSCVRDHDFVGRYGGDEFVLLLPNIGMENGVRTLERIRAEMARLDYDVSPRNERVTVTLSIGITVVREGDDVQSIIRRADEALYRAKTSGRNQVQCYQDDEDSQEPSLATHEAAER